MSNHTELDAIKAENERLISLLEEHGIEWRKRPQNSPSTSFEQDKSNLTPEEKIRLFRALFHGRNDVFPVRWENGKGKSGYSPACDNEWKPGLCEKAQGVKCGECTVSAFTSVSDGVIYNHLSGKRTVGVYPLREDDSCVLLAVDFDEADWKSDVCAYAKSCREFDIPVAVEISRSGNGAHAWIFFSSSVQAVDARRLGTAILSYTCAQIKQLELKSYDRLFPNQDRLPKEH